MVVKPRMGPRSTESAGCQSQRPGFCGCIHFETTNTTQRPSFAFTVACLLAVYFFLCNLHSMLYMFELDSFPITYIVDDPTVYLLYPIRIPNP
ncbi:hypothetical protein ASPFODRAFT_355349 [Aspergillus luchuensis CBS 106.47]|uniref:Uncharacterized protein n=1 Tax=Aspergillus luchuensis (strain CBS 106.47) TaxID=1137211 RepID=A0A1M3T6P1_ASPLC|nr:hypothetical protein ASPFODRAFT_355349 [Aspergillus luchuensis CBS 106.47]